MNRSTLRPGPTNALLAAWLALSAAACGGGGGATAVGGGGPDPVAAPFDIVAAGDIGQCGGNPAASQAARVAGLVRPTDELVLVLGDATYPVGAPSEFADCFQPTWGAFKDRIRPTPGNHEYLTPGAAGYHGYFGAAAGPDRRGYYSFDHRGWHFISLNSNIDAGPDSPQVAWLQADLAATSSTACTLAFWHFPVFSSGRHGNIAHMAAVFAALQAAGVDLVLVGHDHHYERFAPQLADGQPDPGYGLRSFVVGTGGAAPYPIPDVRANSEFRDNSTHGLLRLTLEDGGYRWAFVPVDGGAARDAGSARCRR
ncbi:MAG: metallophosphoesterase family protein [Betaproteobacteria bacterium]